jgi:hypothetical protein
MIKIGSYQFDGPAASTAPLFDRSGIYAILDKRSDGRFYVLDIGESHAIKSRVESHDRAGCWASRQLGTLHVAAHYTPNLQQAGRRLIERVLRSLYPNLCGDR